MSLMTCTHCDRGRAVEVQGRCRPCYKRYQRSPNFTRVLRGGTDEEKFFRHLPVDLDLDACWHWQGPLCRRGYGRFQSQGGRANRCAIYAHVYSYKLHGGVIPDGWEVDHLCHTLDLTCSEIDRSCLHRRCVNPAHLEAVTKAENRRRQRRRTGPLTTHCVHGHLRTPENTYVNPAGKRNCRVCLAENERRYRQSRQAVAS